MAEKPNFPRLEWIQVSDLTVVWPDTQRSYNDARAKAIAANFDEGAFGHIFVVRLSDGRNHIFDGQTRVGAVRHRYGDATGVPCLVIDTDDPKRAARLFKLVNGADSRVKPHPLTMFRVSVEAGDEPETNIKRVVHGLGLHIGSGLEDGAIHGVGALISIHKQYGGNGLLATLVLIREMWGMPRAAYDAQLLRGVALFLAENGFDIDRERLVRKITRKFTPGRLLGSARTHRESFGGSVAMAISALLQDAHEPTRAPRRRLG